MAVAVALVLGSVACSASVTSSSENLRRADLDAIVLSAADSPPGTRFVDQVSGFQDIETFAIDADELDALRRFLDNLRDEQMATHRDLKAEGLGDEAFGVEGTVPSGASVVAFLLRRANLVLAVAGQGDVDVDLVRGLAELVDARATKPLP